VKKLPTVVVVSTGDEIVSIDTTPTPYQVRSSNSYTIRALLQQYCITAETMHLPDEPEVTKEQLQKCIGQYDVIILSGGVSMGKFDYVPKALNELKVERLFHKVQQRPGKPFWFGRYEKGALVFAFPGNPVSTFMCFRRYFVPWLEASLEVEKTPVYAILGRDVVLNPALSYFVQVKLRIGENGKLLAMPDEGNGSGDFANLADTDAFMELPLEQSNFKQGEVYRVWPYKQII